MLLVKNQEAASLIKALVTKEPEERLGNKEGFDEILKHPYLAKRRLEGEMILKGEEELSRYDEEYSLYISEI